MTSLKPVYDTGQSLSLDFRSKGFYFRRVNMEQKKISIGIAGDVMLGRNMDAVIRKKGYAYPWGNTLPLFHDADIRIMNLENAFTHSAREVSKAFNFKAHPDVVKSLQVAGINVVNLANNHIMDYSAEGLYETLETLDNAGIHHVGAGRNTSEASAPCILQLAGIKTGILGMTDNEPSWKAFPGKAGTNYIDLDAERDRSWALDAVQELKKGVDVLIVSIHWGPNWNLWPSRQQVNMAHAMIDYGADLIHGHSAHNFQGIEWYHNKPILYDTGGFVDDYAVRLPYRNDHSFFYTLELEGNSLRKLKLTPVVIRHCQVNLAKGEDARWCLDNIRERSAPFHTAITSKGGVLLADLP